MSRSSVKIAQGAVVCSECELKGDITIGTRTVIHPKVSILAEAGPIIIGENNLIEEQVQIINRDKGNAESGGTQRVMIIGNHNVFEVSACTEAMKVGDNNVLESKAYVGNETVLSNGCIIGARCKLTSNEVLPENTVVYGAECRRRIQQEHPPAQTLQLDFLTKILPNYHHLKKATKTPK